MPANSKRVFFLGAGASKAAGLPLTNQLTAGIAHTLVSSGGPSEVRLRHYLSEVHHVTGELLRQGHDYWDTACLGKKAGHSQNSAPDAIAQLPSIIYILSLLDVFISEENVVYDRDRDDNPNAKQIDRRELDRIREKAVQCVARAFDKIERSPQHRSVSPWLQDFVSSLSIKHDTLITTNWDILLDKAIVGVPRQASSMPAHAAIDYGTDIQCVDVSGNNECQSAHSQQAHTLLKLHGSFGWLYCQRCTTLYSNPQWSIASLGFGDRRKPNDLDADRCRCGTTLFSLLVTPTFLKSYRNRHLGNIWAAAVQRLAEADEWNFVGYSLPQDDLHIRSLLIRALKMRRGTPTITFSNRAMESSSRQKFEAEVVTVFGLNAVRFYHHGAEAFLSEITHPHR